MARPLKFTREVILEGALRAVEQHGRDATVRQVAEITGAPAGSIYHQFPSRDHLMVSLWLESVRLFHQGLLATAKIEDPLSALLAQARHVPHWCREHPDRAVALTLYRQQVLLLAPPARLEEDIRTLNDAVLQLGQQLTTRHFGHCDHHLDHLVMTAIRQCPYGLVRPYIGSGVAIPLWIDDASVAAAAAILALPIP